MFKPLLDAYQGPYKIKFYYWTGLQLVIRVLFFGISSLDITINLTAGIVILSFIEGAQVNHLGTSLKIIKNYF